MVSTNLKDLVTDRRLSSVVPSEAGAEENKDHELTPIDLALKLHYIKGVYFFKSEAVEGFDIDDLKTPMFPWLALDHTVSGRIRRSENGRPFIKCNDSGVRIVEANCDSTVDEWIAKNEHDLSFNDCLIVNGVLGPDLAFSPLVFIQITWFKCGGISLGLHWAHVLGDPFSASTFLNLLGKIIDGHKPISPIHVANAGKFKNPNPNPRQPLSLKRVDPVNDHWVINPPNNPILQTHSFLVTAKQLDDIISSQPIKVSTFQVLSAIIWRSLANIKGDSETRIATVCTAACRNYKTDDKVLSGNNLCFSIVEADIPVTEYTTYELANLIGEKQEQENGLIEEIVEANDGYKEDYTLYGNNLTFVNMEEADLYGLKLKGHRPIFANYGISGVGDQGAVIVLPGPDYYNYNNNNNNNNNSNDVSGDNKEGIVRTVTVVLPETVVFELKKELQKDLNIV